MTVVAAFDAIFHSDMVAVLMVDPGGMSFRSKRTRLRHFVVLVSLPTRSQSSMPYVPHCTAPFAKNS